MLGSDCSLKSEIGELGLGGNLIGDLTYFLSKRQAAFRGDYTNEE